MNNLPRPLLPNGITMPAIRTLSIDTCRVPPISHCGTISLSFTEPAEAKPLDVFEQLQRFFNAVVEGIRNVVQAIANWFNSPQVRRFFKHLASAMRRAGIVQANTVSVRRKAVSTKRARIYQRKHLCIAKS